jgi:serine protease Do
MSPILRILALAGALVCMAASPRAYAQSVRTGALDAGDPKLESGESVDEYPLDVNLGQEVIAIATSVDFDPYLILVAPSGEQFENDDFGDSPSVSLVQEVAGEAGAWRLKVTSFESGETGSYALVLETRARTDAQQMDEEFTVQGAIPEGPTASVSGTIDGSDPQRGDESWYEGWSIDVEQGQRVVFLMQSPDFDTYLTIVSPTGRGFNDDDGGGGTDSRIDMTFDEAGRWTVVANSLSAGDTGKYTLEVERR